MLAVLALGFMKYPCYRKVWPLYDVCVDCGCIHGVTQKQHDQKRVLIVVNKKRKEVRFCAKSVKLDIAILLVVITKFGCLMPRVFDI